MRRSRAIAGLLRIRASRDNDEGAVVYTTRIRLHDVDVIDRLVLDLRIGRVCSFALGYPNAVEVFVTND